MSPPEAQPTAAITSNDVHMDHITVAGAASVPGSLSGSTVAVGGATLEAGTDDCRDSRALGMVQRLVAGGARI